MRNVSVRKRNIVEARVMNILTSFVINLICIDILWKSIEMAVDGHTTTRTVDLIIGEIWALTLTLKDKD